MTSTPVALTSLPRFGRPGGFSGTNSRPRSSAVLPGRAFQLPGDGRFALEIAHADIRNENVIGIVQRRVRRWIAKRQQH